MHDNAELTTNETAHHDRVRFFVQVVAAVAVVVLSIKLGKIFLNNGLPMVQKQYALEILKADLKAVLHAVLLRQLIFLSLLFAISRRYLPRWKWIVAVSPIAGFFVYKGCQAILLDRTMGSVIKESRTALLFLREVQFLEAEIRHLTALIVPLVCRDILFLSLFTLIAYCAIIVTPVRFFRIVRATIILVVLTMFAISGLELAHYLQTGVPGTGQLLGFFLINSQNVSGSWWSMLAAHIDLITVIALFAPFAVGIAVAYWLSRKVESNARPRYLEPKVVLPVTLSLVVLPISYRPSLPDMRYGRQMENTFLALRDLLPMSGVRQVEVMAEADAKPALFDTREAVLHPIDPARLPMRNVIVILMESAQRKATTIYDPSLPTTPFLAEFAKRGAIVSDMYAVIPRTSSAWISVLYGIYPTTYDMIDRWPVTRGGQDRFKSLPQLLGEQGYATAFFTPTHADTLREQELINGIGFQWLRNEKSLLKPDLRPVNYDGLEDSVMVEPALDWVSRQTAEGRPFFLAMMTNVGHDPYSFPASWKKKSFGYEQSDPKYENYLNCIAYIDSVLQSFVQGLERQGNLKSTVIFILGDHGEAFGEHGPRQHILVPYEETLLIPMIMYADGLIAPGTTIRGLRQQPDILPTVLDMLGLQGEHLTVPGISMLQPADPDRKLYYSTSFFDGVLATRQGSTKYIYNFERTPLEVYDLEHDPGEQHDIASTIAEVKRKETILDLLVWRERVRRGVLTPSGTATASGAREDAAPRAGH